MKVTLRILLMLFITASIFSSCSKKSPKEAKLIPKNAFFVLTVDPASLKEKGKVNMDSLVKLFAKDDTAEIQKHQAEFNKIKDAIDWNEKYFLFVEGKFSDYSKTDATINVLGSLKDAAAFEKGLLELKDLKNKNVKKEKDFSYLKIDDEGIVSWNSKYVIVTIHPKTNLYDSTPVADITTFPAKYFNLAESESLASVKQFDEMFKEKGDIYAFSSTNAYSDVLKDMKMPIQLPKLQEAIKDNYSTCVINFEEGKAALKSAFYPNKMLTDVFKKYPSQEVNLSVLENYPSANLNGFLVFSLDPQLYVGLMKELEVDQLANMGLQQVGFTLDDVFKSLKGDISWVVSDVSVVQKTVTYGDVSFPSTEPSYKMILTANVGDKASYAKLMNKFTDMGAFVKNGNVYSLNPDKKMGEVYFKADDKTITIASDSLFYAQYEAKAGKGKISSAIIDKAKGKTAAGYIDIAKLIQDLSPLATNAESKRISELCKATFKDTWMTVGKFDGTKVESEAVLNMTNEKENSLASLVKLFTGLATEFKHHTRIEAPVMEDSAVAIPPPPPPMKMKK
jgi:hypothetical protein